MLRNGLVAILLLSSLYPASATEDTKADHAMNSWEFSAYVTGKTITFSRNGQTYGTEQYFSGKRVRWINDKGDCMDGEWYAKEDQICFVYKNDPSVTCWRFYAGDAGLIAHYLIDPERNPLSETSYTKESLVCKGPDLGV